jgi:hypothetical protein
MIENKENLNELLLSFFDPAEASQIKREIELGEEVFWKYPGPVPDEELVLAIKRRIAGELARKRERKPVFVVLSRAVAVAAVFIILALGGLMFFTSDSGDTRPLAQDIWQDDLQLLDIKAQVDEIADQIRQIRLDEFGDDDDVDFAQWEIEDMEMVAHNTDFWKG